MSSTRKKIGIAVVATGTRSTHVISNLLRVSNRGVRIVTAFDPDSTVMERAIRVWNSPETLRCTGMEEAIRHPEVDWVMIFSPNARHCEQILTAFQAGKHVFSEKPLATTIEDCRKINEAHQRSGKFLATGFVLRYAPLYRKAKELLSSGKLGRILAIEANENIPPYHGGYILCNWRRHTAMAGPHILEKCCHDLDLANWMCDSLPSRVAAFGGREFFTPRNAPLMKKYDPKNFVLWPDPHGTGNPFTDDTDLMDTFTGIAEFRNHIRMTFTATMNSVIPQRRMRFNCEFGTLEIEAYANQAKFQCLGEEGMTVINIKDDGHGHGGGDEVIANALFDSMRNNTPPKCGGAEGLRSAVYALALDEAARTGQRIDLEKIWEKLGC